jgi:hypothetical protein
MKYLAVALTIICFVAACSPKQENVEPARPPLAVPGPPSGSWILDAPNQPAR